MIDIVTPKSLKKTSKKKSKCKTIEDSISIAVQPVAKRRRQDSAAYQEPQSTVPDEDFMLPSIEFVKSEKDLTSADDVTIPSDLDDPNNCRTLNDLIGCQKASKPENHLKCVWSTKRKVLRKNRETCKCYSNLEIRTLELLRSSKILKSKKRFTQQYNDFESSASKIQCDYPYCKKIDDIPLQPSKLIASGKLVKKSKKHQICRKTKTDRLAGVKRPREEDDVRKVRYSRYFINEVTSIMVEHKIVLNMEILTKLVKTKQLNSRMAREVATKLIATRDIATVRLLFRHVKLLSESDVVALLCLVLQDPVYMVADVDGQDKQDLDLILQELLSRSFDVVAMRQEMKRVAPNQAKVLLTLISDKLINQTPVHFGSLLFSQVLRWCDVLVEVYFATLITETHLIWKLYNSVNEHINSSRALFSINEHLCQIKRSKKFKK